MLHRKKDDAKLKHPALMQIRTKKIDTNLLMKWLSKLNIEYSLESHKNGLNLYFSDVNDARRILSLIKREYKDINMNFSTKYAGVRGGRVRILFVYSLK